MRSLELLAPARNADIGIAAIDCGADAVYIASEEFGARKDAANSMKDVARLCDYAHRFGARIFLTVNTIIYDDELERVHRLMLGAQKAGVDAFIVQDLALTTFDDITVPLHASTQCAIRDAGKACFYKSLGFGRLVLERELSLEDIRAISEATGSEIECFVHGALCVCYSGECYMSESLCGRSANRGGCIQACRSLYDLTDASGKVLVRGKALLSLKDLQLITRLEDLADAGACSFKIEGRLKNASYVKNVVREYSLALDALVAARPDEYCRASFGRISGGFRPSADKTFNRGYTSLYIDGERGKWSSMDAPKSMGERIGTIADIRMMGREMEIRVKPVAGGVELRNGDGFCAIGQDARDGKGGLIGFRGDVCEGLTIRCKATKGLAKGSPIYRNISAAFEKELEGNMPRREIGVSVSIAISGSYKITFTARTEDGREVVCPFDADLEDADNAERQRALIEGQISKRAGHYIFEVADLQVNTPKGKLPLLSASILNSIRRLMAEDLDALPCRRREIAQGQKDQSVLAPEQALSYKADVANHVAREVYASRGVTQAEDAYELTHRKGAELMRTRYCIRHELGMCPVHQGAKGSGPLFLENNGRRFALGFDCRNCEMTVSEA